ncbi:MAG TPA: hypothetical protein VFX92_13890 [Candidatus Krumholzibacteria bacterium]|nr:hypothetical protein [Candidatus Krumholzibacteria bacterium]
MDRTAIHYLPIGTTIISAVFCAILFSRYRARRGLHLFWWALGMFTYGLGTALESAITLFGNTIVLTKAWYIAGALLGGYPLAQGSVYLHLKRRKANLLTAITVPLLLVIATLVAISPAILSNLEPHRPSGAVLGWQWVRLTTPFVNMYSVIFLIGGAIYSAYRFSRMHDADSGNRALGNTLIAAGAILPGIGGSMAKAGVVEALYVGEFVGVLFILAGYRACLRPVRVPDVAVEPGSSSLRNA